MRQPIRTVLGLVVSLVLFSVLAMAQPGKAEKNNNEEHHSRLAFWHRHRKADKKSKAHTPSKQFQANRAQMKPASAKQVAPNAKEVAPNKDQKKDQKQEQPEQPPYN
jgi:hypothetical protein